MQETIPTQSEGSQPSFFNMFEKHQDPFLRSISKELNDFYEGGLHKGSITQLYGEAGCGKTQIAMLFTLGVISRGLPVCFLATQKELNSSRLTALAYSFMNQAQYEESQQYLHYKKSSDFNQGYTFIEQTMKKIRENGKGGLLVIDSVHSFIMSCLQFHNIENDVFQKSKKQAEIVNRLRWLAKMSGSAVLFINHAADVIDKRRGSSGRTIVPTLGAAWELNIDENMYLTRKGEIRELSVVNSPKVKRGKKKRFRVESSGLTWISEQGVQYVQ